MSVWQRLRETFLYGAIARKASPEDAERVPTGVLLSMSGNGSEMVYDEDVTGAFARLFDRDSAGDFYLHTTIKSPSSRAQYYRIVPDRVVERVCEVKEVPRG